MSCIIYVEIEPLIKKNNLDKCANNPENSSTTKKVRIFLVDIQCQQFWHLISTKTNILYIVGKTV